MEINKITSGVGNSQKDVFSHCRAASQMAWLLCFVCLWILDYVHFKIRYTKPNGPPVWYFFPFLGALPFFFLPTCLSKPIWNYYFKKFPDVIMVRVLHYTYALVKNAAVKDVQNSEHCLSRPTHMLEKLGASLMTGRPYWFAFDHNDKRCDWRGARKTNLAALNVLSKSARFEKTAEVVDQFLQKVEEQEGHPWDYEEELAFAKVQETSNLNLGETFEGNSIRVYLRAAKTYGSKSMIFFLIATIIPLWLWIKVENFLPEIWRPTLVRTVYARMTERFVQRKSRTIDEPRDFLEAVLRVRKPEAALEFVREIGLFNLFASTYTTQHVTMALLAHAALDKRVQEKIHAELDRVVGSSPLNVNHLSHLHYLKAAIHEAGRLTPPIPVTTRYTSAPALIGGYIVESSMRMMVSLVSETLDAKNFPNPDEFVAERYINENGEFESSEHFNIFSRGKRNCSGPDIARMSTLVYCAKVLQHFEVVSERTDIEIPRFNGRVNIPPAAFPLRFLRRDGSPDIKSVAPKTGLTAVVAKVVEESLASLETRSFSQRRQ